MSQEMFSLHVKQVANIYAPTLVDSSHPSTHSLTHLLFPSLSFSYSLLVYVPPVISDTFTTVYYSILYLYLTHTHTLSLSLTHTHTHTLSLSLYLSISLSHTHTHTLSLSLSHTHTHSLSHTHTLSLVHQIGSIEPKPRRDILMTDFDVIKTVEFPR